MHINICWKRNEKTMYRNVMKRVIDVCLSICGIIVCVVPMCIIAIVIKLDSKGPVIFKQKRLGKGQKTFTVYKFRTMCNHAYEMGGIATRSDDDRITKAGAFLRRTSFDELPQLINIIKGDMAVIGPRPILPIEFEEYKDNKRYCKRYEVRPGLFCTVDIEYRASASRDLQFDMDAEYIENMTFWNDIKYFFKIIKTVISGENVYIEEVQND